MEIIRGGVRFSNSAPTGIPGAERFATDNLADATWGTCKIHGIVRLVNDSGAFEPGGICQFCREEMHDERFFACPLHGINERISGKEGCPVDGCMGEGYGPSEEEIARLAEQIGSIWPGGPPAQQNVLDAPTAGPADVGDRGASVGARTGAQFVLRDDPARREEKPERDPGSWRDPFLIDS